MIVLLQRLCLHRETCLCNNHFHICRLMNANCNLQIDIKRMVYCKKQITNTIYSSNLV